MKRAPRSLQHHVLYRKYNGQDSEISALLGKCGSRTIDRSNTIGVTARANFSEKSDRAENGRAKKGCRNQAAVRQRDKRRLVGSVHVIRVSSLPQGLSANRLVPPMLRAACWWCGVAFRPNCAHLKVCDPALWRAPTFVAKCRCRPVHPVCCRLATPWSLPAFRTVKQIASGCPVLSEKLPWFRKGNVSDLAVLFNEKIRRPACDTMP